MNPESPLFDTYREQLDDEIKLAEFNRDLHAALDTIEADARTENDVRLMTEANKVAYVLENLGIPYAKQIAESMHAAPGNPYGYTADQTRALLSVPFDEFAIRGVPCATYVAHLKPHSYTTPFDVFRIVLATTAQRTLPDGRGIYIARGTVDQTTFMFNVGRRSSDYAERPGFTISEITSQEEKELVLGEIQKAAHAIRPQR